MTVLMLLSLAEARTVAEGLAILDPLRSQRAADAAPTVPADAYTRAASGEHVKGIQSVEGVAASKGWGVAVFDLPVEAVWKAVNDEKRFAGRLPVSESAVVAGTPNRDGRYLFQYMPLPVVDDRWWVVHMDHNAGLYQQSGGVVWELSWKDATDASRVAGTSWEAKVEDATPVAWTHGSWLLVDLEGKTLVEYFVWSDPGGSIPAGPASKFAGGAVLDTLAAMEQLAREHAGKSEGGFVRPDQSAL